MNIRTSEEIFGRPTLTDALVIASSVPDVPSLVAKLQEAFRLEPGIFVRERYSQYERKVHDFVLTMAVFTAVSVATVLLAGTVAANLLHDIYVDRRRQYATLIALGFSPAMGIAPAVVLGLVLGAAGSGIGGLVAILFVPRSFAIPSLMADLGSTQPTLDLMVVGSFVAIGISAVIVGFAPTGLRLLRRDVATILSEGRS